MKKRGKKGRAAGAETLGADFARGFVATGLLSALQDRRRGGGNLLDVARVLRHALQGGAALAAGAQVADALSRRDLALAAAAFAGGAATIYFAEQFMRPLAQPLDQES